MQILKLTGTRMEKQKKKPSLIIKFWPLISLGLVSLGIFLSIKPDIDPSSTGQTTTTIRKGDIRVSSFGSGTLVAAIDIDLAFDTGGIVEDILVEVGDEVRPGQILAVLDDRDFVEKVEKAESALREMTSDAAVAEAALEIAEAQKAVLNAEAELRFLISPYVYKAEIRLDNAEKELQDAVNDAELDPSDKNEQRIIDAKKAVDLAVLSLELNWETYHEEYVPEYFNFRWRDKFGFWHDHYAPPTDTEVELSWAELAAANARVEETEAYYAVITGGVLSELAYGSKLTAFENTWDAVLNAREALEASQLVSPTSGIVLEIKTSELEKVTTKGVMKIAQLDPLILNASFDESDWLLVKEGNPVEVVFDLFPEKIYTGQIIFVDPTLQTRQNTTAINALVELDTTLTGWAGFPLESTASIEIIAGEAQNAVLLPLEGLQEDHNDQGTVLVLEEGEYFLREITLGLRDVIYVEVIDGLSVGDVVLIGNY
jgi:multidrug efflux pump subunit AcrA (membrane-fusion protein)